MTRRPTIAQERARLEREETRLLRRRKKAREAGERRLAALREKHARETVRLCQRQQRELQAVCARYGLADNPTSPCNAAPGCAISLRYKPFEGWSARIGEGPAVSVRETDDERILSAYMAFRARQHKGVNNREWFAVTEHGELV